MLLSLLPWTLARLSLAYCWIRSLMMLILGSPPRNHGWRRFGNAPAAAEVEGESVKVWRSRPKPEWVRREVLRLKALMPENGCRKIAATFCCVYAGRGESVGPTFVANLIKNQAEAILRLRRELKNRVPKKVPTNLILALDLTFLPSPDGSPRAALGVIDHGSRACLALRELTTRRSIDILKVVLDLVHKFGPPKVLRTDNEPIFTSRHFRVAMWLLAIKHQRSAPFAPWQNGRIERLFLTLKERIRSWQTRSGATEVGQADLDLFRAWYNGVRPHQHLEGTVVPAEAWAGRRLRSSRPRYFTAWDGAMTGFY